MNTFLIAFFTGIICIILGTLIEDAINKSVGRTQFESVVKVQLEGVAYAARSFGRSLESYQDNLQNKKDYLLKYDIRSMEINRDYLKAEGIDTAKKEWEIPAYERTYLRVWSQY